MGTRYGATLPMSESTRRAVSLALVVAVAALLFAALWSTQPRPVEQAGQPATTASPTAREVAPDFELLDMHGGKVRLSALRGQVVLVDFWATWCPPCREEVPTLVKLAQRLEGRGLRFIALSEDDPPGQAPLVEEFARQVPGLERHAVFGNPEIEQRFGVDSLPTLFVIDRDGRVADRLVGGRSEGELTQVVESALDDH
jgi:thiol-disulfide isomerase/thioredoxin